MTMVSIYIGFLLFIVWFTCGSRMVHVWFTYAFHSMVHVWFTCGSRMVHVWFTSWLTVDKGDEDNEEADVDVQSPIENHWAITKEG